MIGIEEEVNRGVRAGRTRAGAVQVGVGVLENRAVRKTAMK